MCTGDTSIRAVGPIAGNRQIYGVSFNQHTSAYTGLVEVAVKCNITDDLGYRIPPLPPLVLRTSNDVSVRCSKPHKYQKCALQTVHAGKNLR